MDLVASGLCSPHQPENELKKYIGAFFGAQEFDFESSIHPLVIIDYCV